MAEKLWYDISIIPQEKKHMKFHRVLLFTSLQMDITPIGEDLHVLLTSDGAPYIGCTAFAFPREDSDPEITIISSDEKAEKYFTIYVADQLARKTGQNVLCTGGVFVEEPDEYQTDKLYENIDEMIMDWMNFLSD